MDHLTEVYMVWVSADGRKFLHSIYSKPHSARARASKLRAEYKLWVDPPKIYVEARQIKGTEESTP